MKLLDLTGLYCRTVATGGNWRRYERQYPSLFRHYFQFWAKRSFPDVRYPTDVLLARSELIERRLPRIISRFDRKGFDTSKFIFVLFVGKNCTNGHAYRDENGWVVWIPIESYASKLLVDIFVSHEIAHALHYEHSPKFCLVSMLDQRRFSRLLLTEGIATYLTKFVSGCTDDEALWGGYLRKTHLYKWRSECERNLPMLRRFALQKFHSQSDAELFQANDPEDVLRFRAGYFLGLSLVREIVRREVISANDLIALPRQRLEQLALKYLTT